MHWPGGSLPLSVGPDRTGAKGNALKPPLTDGTARQTAELRAQIEAELGRAAPGLLHDHAVAHYLAAFDALPPAAPYHHVPAAARRICDAIAARVGADALEAYQRLAILTLVERAWATPTRLTAELAALRAAHLARIVGAMTSPRKGFYRHGNDLFAKDFAVCRGKLVPAGVELVDLHSGVGRRTLLGGGIAQVLPGLAFFLGRAGGFKPFYEVHFDRRLIGDFDAAGYVTLYLRLARQMARDPAIRGVVSSSWWHDPALARISPELAFIGYHPENAGAKLLRIGENSAATADALRFAPTRAALHKRGEYRPQVWLLAWARRDILAWEKRQRKAHLDGV